MQSDAYFVRNCSKKLFRKHTNLTPVATASSVCSDPEDAECWLDSLPRVQQQEPGVQNVSRPILKVKVISCFWVTR